MKLIRINIQNLLSTLKLKNKSTYHGSYDLLYSTLANQHITYFIRFRYHKQTQHNKLKLQINIQNLLSEIKLINQMANKKEIISEYQQIHRKVVDVVATCGSGASRGSCI